MSSLQATSSSPYTNSAMVADYFVVVGLSDQSQALESDGSLEEIDLPSIREPITNIAVVFSSLGEKPPPGFELVHRAASTDDIADLNHGHVGGKSVWLCFERKKGESPVTDIDVAYEGSRVTSGHGLLIRSVNGRDANVNEGVGMNAKKTYLTFRKEPLQVGAHFRGMAITDLRVIYTNKGDMPPRGFTKLDKDLNSGLTMGSHAFLCFKKTMIKPPSINYRAAILSRYPMVDHKTFELPESVPLFCLPFGVSIECWGETTAYPLPTFSTFVLTGGTGDKVYGASVTFYEELTSDRLTPQMKESLFGIGKEMTVNVTKCICLLSHWPFFHAYKAFLASLYRISISGPSRIPLERYISNFMLDVPFPSPSRPRVLLQLGNESVMLSEPERTQLPLSVADHSVVLRCLDAENVANLLCFMLLEQKLVIHSMRPALLTSFGEAVTSLLFPFKWNCPYIPLCPLALASFIHAPMPFLIGFESSYFDFYDTPDDVICVNLDSNTITLPREFKNLSWKLLPKKLTRVFCQTLDSLSAQRGNTADDGELAVEVAPLETMAGEEDNTKVSNISVREAFLRFLAGLLKGYQTFLKPITCAPSDSSTDIRSLFDLKGFKKTKSSSEMEFFNGLLTTQMFAKFVEERSFTSHHDSSLAFFDECTDKFMQKEPLVEVENDPTCSDHRTVVVNPPDASGLKRGLTFNYTSFPPLKESLFVNSEKVAMHSSRGSLRTPPGSPLHQRTHAEKRKAKQMALKCVTEPKKWAKLLLGHVYTVWFMHLPAYAASTLFKRETLLKAFKILQYIHLNRVQCSDEVCYRVLMELCGRLGHPALAVRALMEMRKYGIQPDAITYGHYNKAVLDNPWPSSQGHWLKIRILITAVSVFLQPIKKRVMLSPSASLASHPNFNAMRDFSDGSTMALPRSTANSDSEDGDLRSRRASSVVLYESSSESNIVIMSGGRVFSDPNLIGIDDGDEDSDGASSSRRNSNASRRVSPLVRSSVPAPLSNAMATIDSLSQPSPASLTVPSVSQACSSSPLPMLNPITEINSDETDQTVPVPTISGNDESDFTFRRRRTHKREWSDTSTFNLGSFIADFPGGGDIVAEVTIASCSRCPSCLSLLFDEYLLAGWSPDDSNFNARCVFCSSRLIAFLQISPALVGSGDWLDDSYPQSVVYLSPLNLRKEVESLLANEGTQILENVQLVAQHRVLYWNIVWYFARLSLPANLGDLFLRMPELQSKVGESARAKVKAVWHLSDDGTAKSLYQVWQCKGYDSVETRPSLTRKDSQSTIQSITARLQCGDYVTPMERLLSDRLQARGADKTNARTHRSIYWEIVLFLASVAKEKLNTEKVDKDYRAALSRIPKELTHLVRPDDHPPSYPALCCRRIFGPLTM
eukprot:m.235821 g.235821  ORF g.235821 m.235821 type:complete len:1382 (+) comp40129_c1_seq15:72-4217(+)